MGTHDAENGLPTHYLPFTTHDVMKRFTFRLDAVLKYREIQEERCEQNFLAAQGMLANVERQIAALEQERRDILLGRPGSRAGESFDAPSIYDRERYITTIDAALEEQQQFAEAARIVVEEARLALVAAKQARQSVALLRDKEYAAYTAQNLKLEQAALDEIAAMKRGNR
jgi:flagellar protein FliJ